MYERQLHALYNRMYLLVNLYYSHVGFSPRALLSVPSKISSCKRTSIIHHRESHILHIYECFPNIGICTQLNLMPRTDFAFDILW